jgi:hypothetical protein
VASYSKAILGVDDLRRGLGQRLVVAQLAQRVVQQADDAAQAFEHAVFLAVLCLRTRGWRGSGRRHGGDGGSGGHGGDRRGGGGGHLVEQGFQVVLVVACGRGWLGRGGRARRCAGALRRHFLE